MNDQNHGMSGWGDRWTSSIDQLSTNWSKALLPRGKDYNAKGHVTKLEVATGKMTAKVQGSKSKPYATTLELQPFKPADWDRVIHGLAQEAHWAASFLNGVMPERIEQRFAAENLTLFPTRNSELIISCNCSEKARPCKHIAAVQYAFGEALDRDPFLLFLLRGKSRAELLDGFHRAWFPDAPEEVLDDVHVKRDHAIAIMPLSADRFNRSSDEISEIAINLRPADAQSNILQKLDVPSSWEAPITPSDLLSGVIEKASAMALEFALTNLDLEAHESLDDDFDDIDDDSDADEDPLFRALSGAMPSASSEAVSALPTSLPGAALLQGAIGVDLDAAAKNQSRSVGRKKAVEPAPAPQAAPQPVVLRRRAASAPVATSVAPPVEESPAPPAAKVTTRKKAVTAPTVDAPPTAEVPAAAAPAVVRRRSTAKAPATAVEAVPVVEPIVEAVETPVVTRRARTVVGAKPVRRQPVVFDTAARAAWEEGDVEKTWENALEAWKIEPSDSRYQLLAASADRLEGVSERFETLAKETEDEARRGGRRVTTHQLLVLLTAGQYDVATEFILAMDDAAWMGEDPPGAVFLTFLLMALASERSVPDSTNLSKIWDELFARGEKSFPESEDPPAPVGAWLDFALQDTPYDESQEEKNLEVARTLGIGLIEVARERPVSLRASKVAHLSVAVAEALQLLADEDECDRYTAVASARAAADDMLARSVREAIRESALLGYHGS